MFQVPDWEDDIPKSNLNFIKSNKKTKKPPTPKTPQAKSLKPSTKLLKQKDNTTKTHNATQKENNRKRKINVEFKTKKKETNTLVNIDTDKLDEAILNAKKKKFNEALAQDDVEQDLFQEDSSSVKKKKILKTKQAKKGQTAVHNIEDPLDNGEFLKTDTSSNKKRKKKTKIEMTPKTAIDLKKERIKQMMSNNRNSITVKGNQLRERMLERLKSAQFRYLNEKLYTSSGSEAKQLFANDPAAFQTYHEGYQQQVKKWPIKPLDVIVKRIRKMPKTHAIADMGCGEAALSKLVPHEVRSFDLVSTAAGVEVCDMAHTPLLSGSMDVVVYCLALMGTELTQYLVEANRVLNVGGHLLIAEVESRFDKVEDFTKDVEKLGFKLKKLDKSNDVFFFMEFVKVREAPVKKSKLPVLTLKPCLYKKR